MADALKVRDSDRFNAFLVKAINSKRWTPYFIKAALFVLFLFLFGRLAPVLPPFCVLLFWVAVSIVSAIGYSYHYVIRKARNRYGLKDGGISVRLNDGRVLCLTISFFVSVVATAGLIFEVPKWEPVEWLILVLAIPLYMGIFHLVNIRAEKEWEPLLRVSRCVLVSGALLGVALLVIYILIGFVGNAPSYSGLTEAFLAAKKPYAESSSVILSEVSYFSALIDGFASFAIAEAAKDSVWVYVLWRIVICVGTIFGLASLIAACSLKYEEMRLVFMPLKAVDKKKSRIRLKKRFVITACVLPILMICVCVVAETKATEVTHNNIYTATREFIRSQVGISACVIDGKPYDSVKAKELLEREKRESQAIAEDREAALTPLINEVYDKRIENIDRYLDWYYSLPAVLMRRENPASEETKSATEKMFNEKISEGVDESALYEQFDHYQEKLEKLKANIQDELAKYDFSKYSSSNIPDWLIMPQPINGSGQISSKDFLSPTQEYLDVANGTKLNAGPGTVPVFDLVVDFVNIKIDELLNRGKVKEQIKNAIESDREKKLEMVRVSK